MRRRQAEARHLLLEVFRHRRTHRVLRFESGHTSFQFRHQTLQAKTMNKLFKINALAAGT
jgi:hypothetical protein